MDNSTVGKRLTYYLKKQGFTKKQFCHAYNIQYNGFVMILSGSRNIGINVLHQVHEALPNLNTHWLLYGIGPEEVVVDTNAYMVAEKGAEYKASTEDEVYRTLQKLMKENYFQSEIKELIASSIKKHFDEKKKQ